MLAAGRKALAAGAVLSDLDLGSARRAMAAVRDASPLDVAARADDFARRIAALAATTGKAVPA